MAVGLMEKKMYKRLPNGSVREWLAGVQEVDGKAILLVGYGKMGGKMATSKKIIKGKNIGRSNETTPYEQALLELTSAINKKYDEGYRDTLEEIDNVPVLPMLARPYESYKDKIVYPLLAQPKLNGMRCIATRVGDSVMFTSRNGKEIIPVKWLAMAVHPLLQEGARLDGELYVHGWSLNRIVAAAKAMNEDTLKLQYHVYDFIPEDDMSCIDRQNILANALMPTEENMAWVQQFPVKWVPTQVVNNEIEYTSFHNEVLNMGFEGSILRHPQAPYRRSQRTSALLKRKDFMEEDFTIVDYSYEELVKDDKIHRMIIFKCAIGDKIFNVVPSASRTDRIKMYNIGPSYIGKTLSVRFLEYSDYGIPQGNPVGVCVRDYE